MKKIKLVVLILLCIASTTMAIIIPFYVKDTYGVAIIMMGMISGALGMLLIILMEYVYPYGLYMRSRKTRKQIRIL